MSVASANGTVTAKAISSRKAAKAAAILDAAEAVMIAQGASFEISELAKAAGVSNGLAYHYFGSKDGLIEAVVERFYLRYSDVIDRRADPDIDWGVRERVRLEEAIAFLYADPFAATVFSTLSHSSATLCEIAHQRVMSANAAHNIRSGQKRGQIALDIDAELAGAAIAGAIRQTIATAMRMQPRPEPAKLAEQLWRLIAAAVGLDAD
ncbi:MAG: TetR/AcrR family transcriptional regulator [Pseudomonadota bacterium]